MSHKYVKFTRTLKTIKNWEIRRVKLRWIWRRDCWQIVMTFRLSLLRPSSGSM